MPCGNLILVVRPRSARITTERLQVVAVSYVGCPIKSLNWSVTVCDAVALDPSYAWMRSPEKKMLTPSYPLAYSIPIFVVRPLRNAENWVMFW